MQKLLLEVRGRGRNAQTLLMAGTSPECTVRCAHSSGLCSFWFSPLEQEGTLREGSARQQPWGFSGLAGKTFSANLLRCIKALPHRFLLYPYTKRETELGYLGFQASGRGLNLRPLCNHQECCWQTQDLRNSHSTHQKQA